MTTEEAKQILEDQRQHYALNSPFGKALTLAIQALSKQGGEEWVSVDEVTELYKLYWCEISNKDHFEGTTIITGCKCTYGGNWIINFLPKSEIVDIDNPNESVKILRVYPLPSPPNHKP